MKRKKGCCVCILLTVISLIFLCIYAVRTSNVILGSNTYYYRDIFNYPGTEWYCEEAGIELKVYDLQKSSYTEYEYFGYTRFAVMKMKIDGEEKEFVMIGERGHIEIYEPYLVNGECIDKMPMFYGFANYKRSFFTKEVTSFTIYDIREDSIFNNKYEKLKFQKK